MTVAYASASVLPQATAVLFLKSAIFRSRDVTLRSFLFARRSCPGLKSVSYIMIEAALTNPNTGSTITEHFEKWNFSKNYFWGAGCADFGVFARKTRKSQKVGFWGAGVGAPGPPPGRPYRPLFNYSRKN